MKRAMLSYVSRWSVADGESGGRASVYHERLRAGRMGRTSIQDRAPRPATSGERTVDDGTHCEEDWARVSGQQRAPVDEGGARASKSAEGSVWKSLTMRSLIRKCMVRRQALLRWDCGQVRRREGKGWRTQGTYCAAMTGSCSAASGCRCQATMTSVLTSSPSGRSQSRPRVVARLQGSARRQPAAQRRGVISRRDARAVPDQHAQPGALRVADQPELRLGISPDVEILFDDRRRQRAVEAKLDDHRHAAGQVHPGPAGRAKGSSRRRVVSGRHPGS